MRPTENAVPKWSALIDMGLCLRIRAMREPWSCADPSPARLPHQIEGEETFMRFTYWLAALFVTPLIAAHPLRAQSYPSQPIQMIVPFSAGQSIDLITRTFVQGMAAELHQPVTVENIPGASGILAFNAAARAKPDGYTLVMAPQGQLTIQPHLHKDLAYTFQTFKPICQLFENVFPIIVKKDSPIRTFKDLVARAQAKPGGLTWATSGVATVSDLQMTDLLQRLKLKLVHVTYRRYGQMIQDVIGGQIDFAVPSLGSFAPESVHLVVLMSDKRLPEFPDLPAITEYGYTVSLPGFGGLYAPAAAPPDVHAKLAAICPKVFASAAFQKMMHSRGLSAAYLPGDKFAERLKQDSDQKAALIKALGLDRKLKK
jgi:tripartite-type tricarboxylate transporter receptor subunit TctC